MDKVLLSLHVLAAIVTVGPVTAAAWAFVALDRGDRPGAPAVPAGPLPGLLHRVTVLGAVAAVAVPVLGVGTAVQLDVLTDAWLLVAMALTAVAAAVFVVGVVGGQRRRLDGRPAPGSRPGGVAGATLAFTVLWVAVVTLMVFRPGSTTGAA
jgi:hypothetical protein